MLEKRKIVIVGNGMVGHHFVEQVIEQQKAQHNKQQSLQPLEVTVLSAESRLAYDRVHLSEFFSGKTADDLAMTTPKTYHSWDVNFRTNAKVEHIDRQFNVVKTVTGETFSYDKLILATGSYPFVPPIPGHKQPHCLVYRTIEDLHAIERSAKSSKVGVVIGGGLLGLEAANAIKQLGLETHVVEFAPQLMAVQVDAGGGQLLRSKIESLGVQVHTSKVTQNIGKGEQCRYQLQFADGEVLETDMILFSAGIRPYDELAKMADLAVGERGGVVINNLCQTSDPSIYAIGECALWQNFIFGLVAPGYSMAKVAAKHIFSDFYASADVTEFTGADLSTKLKLMGVDVGSIGDAHGKTPGSLACIFEDQPNSVYKKIVISEDKTRLLGAVLVGDNSEYDTLLQYMLNDIDLPETPEALILPKSEGEVSLGASALPDTATICSCHNVSKGDIVAALDDGCTDLGEIKSCTKASTGCGGCAALVKNVFEEELQSRGVSVKQDICEHFPYSRRQLFDLIKVEKIKTFDELLEKHGSGLGCEVCKPTTASILASIYNDYILDKFHLPLQDSNDNFLANLQKDGTYSVVPRIPGGEVTPEKLIVIGQVAQKYDLYTKITGGQRIDMFGARVEQLPLIWQELIDAGFETGHAYGKSVRTVKSCVGSTWCRFGVQDSLNMALDLENRYKGLRSPHKLKFAVSGCTRECAEAQSKDIGVIATENGWNLYVCGNGGMRPRHADLFATDLDDKTLLQYIDRILIFYTQTADRLQRTSVWLENLEGGLDYLKQVIIDDSLGLSKEMETQMENIVGKYQCEWKTTLEDPIAMKRFKAFVNCEEQDENIVFVKEREQIRPAKDVEKLERIAVVVDP